MSVSFKELVTSLENDQQSGALELATQTLQDLHSYLTQTGPFSQQELQTMSAELAAARPSMHALENALSRWQTKLSDDHTDNLKSLEAVLTSLQQASQRVIEHALPLVRDKMKILLHSRSSLVTGLFEAIARRQISVEVFATLSAPGHEGRLLASELSQLGFPVTLITDAEMGLVMPEVDLNLSGCDCWLSDGYFVNKTGTLLQALAAHDQHKPFWVLADSFKNSTQTHQTITLESHPEAALNLPEGSSIRGLNIWFETISTKLISGRIDETGRHALNKCQS